MLRDSFDEGLSIILNKLRAEISSPARNLLLEPHLFG